MDKKNSKLRAMRSLGLCAIALAGLMVVTPPLEAQSGNDGDWQWDASIYLWRTDIGGQTGGGSDINVDFGDVLSSLDYGFMGFLGARKGKWSVFGDLVLVDAEDTENVDVSVPIEPGTIDVNAAVKAQLQSWVVNVGGGYALMQSESSGSRLDLVLGVRYLDIDADLDLDWTIDGEQDGRRFSEGNTNFDAFIGLKGHLAVGRIVSIPYYVDVGTGDSDLTWQALVGLNFRVTRWLDIPVVYRYLEWELASNRLVSDLNFGGVAAGLSFRF